VDSGTTAGDTGGTTPDGQSNADGEATLNSHEPGVFVSAHTTPSTTPADAAAPAGAPDAPAEAGPTPELDAPLPEHLRLSVRDGEGAWSVDVHRHHGSLDLLFRGDNGLAGAVRDAEPEIRHALANAGQDLGLLEFASANTGDSGRDPGATAQGQTGAGGHARAHGRDATGRDTTTGRAPLPRAPTRSSARVDRVA